MTARQLLAKAYGASEAGHRCRLGARSRRAFRNWEKLQRKTWTAKHRRRSRYWIAELERVDNRQERRNTPRPSRSGPRRPAPGA